MSVSDVKICNLALSDSGHDVNISAIGEDGRAGETCELYYEAVRDALLQSHLWNFATKRATLSLNGDAPAFEYANAYQLPADCLRAVSLYGEGYSFKVESGLLLTDAPTANLIYIKKVTDTTLYPPYFVRALYKILSVEMSPRMTKAEASSSKIEAAKEAFRMAKRFDGQEGTPGVMQTTGPSDYKTSYWFDR